MSGQCYSCGVGFSFFKKELGCKNCGFAFCKDCLTKKTAVPKLNNENHKVCNRCFNILTGKIKPQETSAKFSPPEAYKKRIAALSDPKTHSGHAKTNIPSKAKANVAKYRGMAKEDIAIAQRLEKLKEERAAASPPVPSLKEMEGRLEKLKGDRPPPPGDDEMRDRLARLKGQDPAQANKPHVFQTDRRHQQQQVDDLLDQIGEEVMIDSRGMDPAQDVQSRLDHLQDTGQGNATQPEIAQQGNLQNNLNMGETDKPSQLYTKNIMPPADNFQTASGEKIDWNEMNNLIQQVAAEMEVDAQKAIAGLQKDKELWSRLEKIKEDREKKRSGDNSNELGEDSPVEEAEADRDGDSEDEDVQTKKLIKQLLEEQALDDRVGDVEPAKHKKGKKAAKKGRDKSATSSKPSRLYTQEESSSEEDELPWCCICNEDAKLRCHGCDGDLYCNGCYREGHDREDYADHPTSKYRPPDKKK